MPKMQGGITTSGIALQKFIEDVDKVTTSVGFLGGQAYPEGDQVGDVARENELGNVEEFRPPRPFMRPAMYDLEAEAPIIVAAAIESSSWVSVDTVFEELGRRSMQKVVEKIEDVVSPGLSDTTKYFRRQNGNMSTKPLEDTLTMKNSVAYEVTKSA